MRQLAAVSRSGRFECSDYVRHDPDHPTRYRQGTGRAEEPSQQTRFFVHRVRSVTRRRYTPEEKIRIVGG